MKTYALLFAGLTLSACGGASIDVTPDTGFPYAVLLPEGENINDGFDTTFSGQSANISGVGSSEYLTGQRDGRNLGASILYPNATPGPSPASNLVFSGSYNLGNITDTLVVNRSGFLTLNVDAAANTITGISDDTSLVVNGTYSGNEIGGTVEYQGLEGTLDGVISTSGAVGAFAGANDTSGYAGVLSAQ